MVQQQTPFVIFDFLDKALFGGKLRGMVYMRWKTMVSSSPGTTSAPGVVSDIPRICIELNKSPFEVNEAAIDDLLDSLIHQMIHAFFLVACGAQPKCAKQDGRLMDGLHFGVIMYTIRDITRRCQDGILDLIFYAAERVDYCGGHNDGGGYIAIDPRGGAVGSAPADGQSHCNHDNRKIRPAQIKNWQVEGYSVAIDLDMESKGNDIYDLGADNVLVKSDRLTGPPSSSYVELLWDDKRIIVPREKAVKYKSIKKPLEKNSRMELQVPECDFATFCQVYNFFTKGSTGSESHQFRTENASIGMHTKGPPVILNNASSTAKSDAGLIVHLQLFKVAEAIKFEELEQHVLQQLWSLPATVDDPIEALKILYNDEDTSGPIHSELHKWARAFLLRRDEGSGEHQLQYGWQNEYQDMCCGSTNYDKLKSFHLERFTELYHRNTALKEDCKIVWAQICMDERVMQPGYSGWCGTPAMTGGSAFGLPTLTESEYREVTRPSMSRTRSFYNPMVPHTTSPLSAFSPSPWLSSRSTQDDMVLLPSANRPRRLDWRRTPTPFGLPNRDSRYCGHDGRMKAKDLLTDQMFFRRPARAYEGSVYSY
ncbi:hypothetical protein LTR36_002014 [Oleoguttula mirabilis]|uniref:SprT-like domain-containing protein n=1 Tax=Oleoguttula mirabilis TaxID=1507867 RepID=A0AAV9JLZ0_9PEZI|nr:hypothetical protein LTR36_002014 [Oleoguttula mirabilis]